MCLKITRGTPYDEGNIRYKILYPIPLYEKLPAKFCSPFRRTLWIDNRCHLGNKKISYDGVPEGSIAEEGIHVFVSQEDAKKVLLDDFNQCGPSDLGYYICQIVKIKVSGFLAAGEHYRSTDTSNGMRGEVWSEAEIVEEIQ